MNNQSILIIGPNPEERLIKAREILIQKSISPHDTIELISTQSYGIEDIRDIINKISFSPYESDAIAALIHPLEQLTQPAQHALLKTLEEPPTQSILILTAASVSSVLPTIVSRCRVVFLSHSGKESIPIPIIYIGNRAERMVLAGKYGQKRDEAKDFVNQLINEWRGKLLKTYSAQPVSSIKHALLCLKALDANVNPRLALEHFLLSLP